MSEPRRRGPRTPTVLTRLADLPTPTFAERRAIFQEEKAAAKARNLAASARRKREEVKETKGARIGRERRMGSAPIAWLREPAYVGGIRVWGVAADAADDVKERYL